jgi:sodium/potassium-transporting ATPase subunit alpha
MTRGLERFLIFSAESDLLKRNPRNVKTDHLADWKLLLHAYGFLGVLETVTSMASAFYL